MKQIIKPSKNLDLISFEEVSAMECPNIGLIDNAVSKGFLVPDHYYDYGTSKKTVHYFARAVKFFSKGNGWNSSQTRTLEGWFNFFGEDAEFFVFNTPEELFKWLSEK